MASQQFPQIKKIAITDRTTVKPVVRYQFTVDAGPPGNWQTAAGTPPSRDGTSRFDNHPLDSDARGNTLLPMHPI
jgi:hypothetical protein